MRTLVAHRRAWAMVAARGTANIAWFGFLTYNSIRRQRPRLHADGRRGSSRRSRASRTRSRRRRRAASPTSSTTGSTRSSRRTCRWAPVSRSLSSPRSRSPPSASCSWGAGFGLVLSIYRSVITTLPPADLRGGLVSLGEGSGRAAAAATATPVVMGVAVAVATSALGFDRGSRGGGVGTGVVSAGVGIACLLLMSTSPPIRMGE